MIAKMASVLTLSILVLSAVAAQAQTPAPDANARIGRPYPFPAPGSFSGRVLTRNFRPIAIPMGGSTQAQPAIAPAPDGMIMPLPTQPVGGAQVQITWSMPIYYGGGVARRMPMPPERVWNTTTGPDGSFGFRGLPMGSFKYRVQHREFTAASGSFSIQRSIGVQQDIYLKRSWSQVGSFAGRVTATPRWPLPFAKAQDAQVDASLAGAPAAPASAEEAAADALTTPEPGATPPDAAGATAAGSPASNLTIAKRIYMGRPIAGADVTVTSFWGPYPLPRPLPPGGVSPAIAPADPASLIAPMRTWKSQTDGNGNFGIKGLPAGRYSYRVTHKYFQPRGGTFFVGEFDPSVVRNVQLERRVRGIFSGIVGEGPRMLLPVYKAGQPEPLATSPMPEDLNKGGQILPFKFSPLAGARVVVMRSRQIYHVRPQPVPLSQDGRAVVNAAGSAPAAAEAAGSDEEAQLLKASESDVADAPATEDTALDTIDLDAEISAGASADPKVSAPGGVSGIIAHPMPPIWNPWYRRAVTNDRGQFTIASLPAGTYLYVVRAANHQPQLGRFTINQKSPRVHRRVLMPSSGPGPVDSGVVNGTVLGYSYPPDVVFAHGGAPNPGIQAPQPQAIAGANISWYIPPPPGMFAPQIMQVTTSDSNGNFSIKAPFGTRFTVHVSAQGWVQSSQEVTGGQRALVYLKREFTGFPPPVVKPLEGPTVSGSDVEDPFKK